ncbi:MAG: hypothetical protein II698_02575 [Ruminococcus sp.]|nr:hypothetical protein [Ruminococcus sp.]MBQ4238172.1 hypothetical protein [Ruminococcus sp.]
MFFTNDQNRPENVIAAAQEETVNMRDMRILRAKHSDRGWQLKYIALDDDLPVAAIERSLSRRLGEMVRMVNLHYDFDTAARMIYA